MIWLFVGWFLGILTVGIPLAFGERCGEIIKVQRVTNGQTRVFRVDCTRREGHKGLCQSEHRRWDPDQDDVIHDR